MALQKSETPGLIQNELNELFDAIDESFVSHFVNIHSLKFYRSSYLPKLKWDLQQDAKISRQSLSDTYQRACHIGDEDETESMVYQTTYGQLIPIAETPGRIENRQAANLIVSIYQSWEDTYRAKVAALLGIKKDDLKADIWGDLRHIRRSILHRDFRAVAEIDQCKIIKSFSPGKPIIFSYSILNLIKNELHKWYDQFMYGVIHKYKIQPLEKTEQPAPNL